MSVLFSKQFLIHTGQRPLNYIHGKKIERAQYLIATTNKSFLEIALETGFSNLLHFSKIFKQIVSLAPGNTAIKIISTSIISHIVNLIRNPKNLIRFKKR